MLTWRVDRFIFHGWEIVVKFIKNKNSERMESLESGAEWLTGFLVFYFSTSNLPEVNFAFHLFGCLGLMSSIYRLKVAGLVMCQN